jgi:hypothetical protein
MVSTNVATGATPELAPPAVDARNMSVESATLPTTGAPSAEVGVNRETTPPSPTTANCAACDVFPRVETEVTLARKDASIYTLTTKHGQAADDSVTYPTTYKYADSFGP